MSIAKGICLKSEWSKDIGVRLEHLSNVRKCIKDLQAQEAELSAPMNNDYAQIKDIYDAFVCCMVNAKPDVDYTKATERCKFLFVVLAMYSPRTLCGSKMPKGLRQAIARVVRCEDSVLSHNIESLYFRYQRYRGFRKEVDMLFDFVVARLEGEK